MDAVSIHDVSCLFLDRDGVINVDSGYVHRKEDFYLCSEIVKLIRLFNSRDIPVVIVTNQAGIGHGYYDLETYLKFQTWVEKYLSTQKCLITKSYYSPYHPQAKVKRFQKDSWLRKPGPGMFYKAKFDLGIHLQTSILIGDKVTDVEAADAAGVGYKFLLTGAEENHIQSKDKYVIHDLPSIYKHLSLHQ